MCWLDFFAGVGVDGGGEQKNTPTGFLYILRFASLVQGVHTYFMIILSFHLKYMFLMEENQAVTSMLRVVMTKIPNKSLGFNHLRRISADQLEDYWVVPSHNSRGEYENNCLTQPTKGIFFSWDCKKLQKISTNHK